MLDRYEHETAAPLFTRHAKLGRWWDIERAWVLANHPRGGLAIQKWEELQPEQRGGIATCADSFESQHGHDVLAFVEAVAHEFPDREWATRWYHWRLTSSDVVDTADSLLIREIAGPLRGRVKVLGANLVRLANQPNGYDWSLTHGRQAEPYEVDHPYRVWHHRLDNASTRLYDATARNQVGRFRGPTGEVLFPLAETRALEWLGLNPVGPIFQAVDREIRAEWFDAVAGLFTVLEGLAQHLKRWIVTGRLEWRSLGVPSSAMPNKRNPSELERVMGLARLYRAAAQASWVSVPMWDDRDIAHSSVDRVLLEMAAHFGYICLETLAKVLAACVPDGAWSRDKPRTPHQRMNELVEGGMSRADARVKSLE